MDTGHQVGARKLGATGLNVFPLALGCMGMSGMYGAADDNESISTIHAALDAGVNLIDTGDFYGMGHNEMLISRSPEAGIFPALNELGIGVTAYGVLSRGLLSGSIPASQGDFRAGLPRFSGENFVRNQELIRTLGRLAADKGVS